MDIKIWLPVLIFLLINIKAYLCTQIFIWNDRRNNTNKDTISGKIQVKLSEGKEAAAKRSPGLMDFLKSYTSCYVQIYGYYFSYFPSRMVRKFVYKTILGCKIGKHSAIHYGAKMVMPHRISIGDNSLIGEFSYLDGRMFLEIGNNVNLSSGVTIWTLQHDPYSPDFAIEGGVVKVEENVWISFRSTILPRVTVKRNCVIGAHSLVTKTTNEAGVYFGSPAKEVKKRDIDIHYKLKPDGFFT